MTNKRNVNYENNNQDQKVHIIRRGQYIEHSSHDFRQRHENVGTESTKPLDLNLMTGNNVNDKKNR